MSPLIRALPKDAPVRRQIAMHGRNFPLVWPALMVIPFAVVLFGAPDPILTVGMQVFRGQVASAELPEYPAVSQKAGHSGRVAADVLVTPDGKVTEVNILESPDEAIGNSVRAAVMKWVFKPFKPKESHGPFVVKGRVVFYFRSVDGKPQVIDAAAQPGPSTPPQRR